MTNSSKSRNTPAFYAQAAISFGLSMFGLLLGVLYMPVEPWMRAFIAVDALFMVSSAFTLSKCVRDAQEDDAVISRLDAARLERLLAEYDPYRPPVLPDLSAEAKPEPPSPAPPSPAPPPALAYPGYAGH